MSDSIVIPEAYQIRNLLQLSHYVVDGRLKEWGGPSSEVRSAILTPN